MTPILIVKNESVIAIAGIGDSLRAGIKDALTEIKRSGRDLFLLSGDNKDIVENTALRVGIPKDKIFAENLPNKKPKLSKRVKKLP